MTKNFKRYVALLVLLVLVAAVALVLIERRSVAQPAAGARHSGAFGAMAVPVDVAPVSQRDLPVYLNGLGTVQAYNTVTVVPQVSGQLISVPFHQGDEVKKGQLLAKIDPRTYKATLDQAKAKLAQDQANLASAKLDLSRYTRLAPSGYVSGQQLSQQQAQVASGEALVQADRAAVESAAVQLSYTDIVSPIEGRLGLRLVDVGNVVTPGQGSGIVVVTQMKPIYVTFTLPEQNLEQVLAAGAHPPVTALDRGNSGRLATGTLTAVDNQINQATGTIELKATFANSNEKLWPGQFVNVRLLAATLAHAVVVPVTAVQQGPDGTYVYLLGDDHKVAMQPVETGVTQGGFVQITKGLRLGQQVVVDGQYRLKPGATVKPQEVTPAAAASVAAPVPTAP
ncbi:MAG TPA: efflux RND transporter periplasmic adaptor subunit [Nevskiaceae bacterium]